MVFVWHFVPSKCKGNVIRVEANAFPTINTFERIGVAIYHHTLAKANIINAIVNNANLGHS